MLWLYEIGDVRGDCSSANLGNIEKCIIILLYKYKDFDWPDNTHLWSYAFFLTRNNFIYTRSKWHENEKKTTDSPLGLVWESIARQIHDGNSSNSPANESVERPRKNSSNGQGNLITFLCGYLRTANHTNNKIVHKHWVLHRSIRHANIQKIVCPPKHCQCPRG